MKTTNSNALGNLAALGFGLVLLIAILLIIETGLRYKYDDGRKFYYTFRADILNHADLFKRSPLPRSTDPQPRIFCLGGSTTNGCNMPAEYSYPNLLQMIFVRENKLASAYNFGISGVNSVTTNYFIKNILPKYDPACVVIHDGYNDLPIVIKKLGEDKYSYITPDYHKPFNPYIANPVMRYISSFIKFNLRATRRFVVTFVKNRLNKGGDLFLGFDYTKYKRQEGSMNDILQENKKRMEIMVKTEMDSINYCLKHGIKVIVILEPYIKPMHWDSRFGTGFRDENVGYILSECHKIQQSVYALALYARFRDNPNVAVLDMREIFKDKYPELFYDECHLNGKGNAVKAKFVFDAVDKLFDLKPARPDK